MSIHRPVACLIIASLCLGLVGCSQPDSGEPTKGSSGSVPTLTKDNLPTAIGTTYTMVRKDVEGTPLTLNVEGPWELSAGDDWSSSTYEIVDPQSVPGIDEFEDYTYVTKLPGTDSPSYYYPRQVTDEWVMGLGRITVDGDDITPEPSEPTPFWPLELEVGKSYEVGKTDEYTTEAVVLARNTAKLPAGVVENTYLARFRTTQSSGEVRNYYYMFAPNLGMVAYISGLEGSEEDGFTAASSIVLLASMPTP